MFILIALIIFSSRCKILIACGHFLVEPNLPPGEKLSGANLQKIMKGSNAIYLQPEQRLNSPRDIEVVSTHILLPAVNIF